MTHANSFPVLVVLVALRTLSSRRTLRSVTRLKKPSLVKEARWLVHHCAQGRATKFCGQTERGLAMWRFASREFGGSFVSGLFCKYHRIMGGINNYLV